jgi:hypothetical protein
MGGDRLAHLPARGPGQAFALHTPPLPRSFEVWFPGETEISVTTVLCDECGFVTYLPRSDEAAIDAKYRLLTSLDLNRGPAPQMPRKSGNGELSFIAIFEASYRGAVPRAFSISAAATAA